MPKTKLLEGYLDYLKNSNDPNLEQCRQEHGADFLRHSIDAWKSEMRPEDRGAIPSKAIIRMFKRRKNRYALP